MTTPAQKRMQAADDLNRGIAMVTTVWLAQDAAETADDQAAMHDALYEAIQKLRSAERLLGCYQTGDGQ